jgi:hypothetical protein
MKQTISVRRSSVNIHVGCFGNFRLGDPICRKHCALRIRCAIERDQNAFMETMEGMEAGADFFFNFQ